MPEIFVQRDGLSFPVGYTAPGTTHSEVLFIAAIPIRYSLTDPLAIVPPDDLIPRGTVAHVVADPLTYMGGDTPIAFDALHDAWVILTYAGSKKLFLTTLARVGNLDADLTQPTKIVPGPPPITVLSPYGIDDKLWAILFKCTTTHPIDHQES